MTEFLKDVSRFQGWLEFNTPSHGWIRAEDCGARIYHVYVQHGDAFIKSYTVRADHRARNKESLMKSIHREICDADREEIEA
jgi:hypothetical protein